MNQDKFSKINLDSVLNRNSVIRRIHNGKYEYFVVTGFDTERMAYTIESSSITPEKRGWQLLLTTEELIENFEQLT
jgi:hypothetical protein